MSASHLLLMSLAVAFVLYHVYTATFGTVSFVRAYLPKQTDTDIAAHATKPTPLFQHTVQLGIAAEASLWPQRITMPTVDIDLPVEGSIEQAGEWKISENGADFALNTSVPNPTSGNTAIFGHDRPHLFRRIHDLKVGDQITVTNSQGSFIYAMTGSKVVTPQDISVMDQTETSTLTLLTCDGWLSQNRYVVTAKFTKFIPAE